MSTLYKVPHFEFENGNEPPITVRYYNGSIELSQFLRYEEKEVIVLDTDQVKALFKEITRHLPEVKSMLEK